MTRLKAVIASYLGVLVCASFIFIGAGKLDYWQGLFYTAIALAGASLSHVLEKPGSNLMVERAARARSGQSWDKRLLAAIFFSSIVMFVVAGLDSGRFNWSGPIPLAVTIAGGLLMLTGQALFAIARRVNDYFSSTVRIQSERGHAVCDKGPYRFLRHPGYLGMLISVVAFPLVLNSHWAFLPACANAALLIVRTAMEDRLLTAQLPGYQDYATKVRWKLLPGVY